LVYCGSAGKRDDGLSPGSSPNGDIEGFETAIKSLADWMNKEEKWNIQDA
jgi:hypothetical protein